MSVLSLTDLSVQLGARQALDAVTLTVQPGECVALVGPNGAGKTTLLRAALGLIPFTGDAALSGDPVAPMPPAVRARRAAYLAQERSIAWSLLGGDLAALGRYAWGGGRAYDQLDVQDRAAVDRALEKADATALKDRPVQQLSGGEQARLHLARLLASSAPLLIADEPAAALDPRHQLDALAALKAETENGSAVLVALHDLALAERLADRILVLNEGKLVGLGPAQSVLDAQLLADVFRIKRREDGGFEPA
jgi:iron complex transport system ATP-binding protein